MQILKFVQGRGGVLHIEAYKVSISGVCEKIQVRRVSISGVGGYQYPGLVRVSISGVGGYQYPGYEGINIRGKMVLISGVGGYQYPV